tara:strand:+ start:247 stop:636 length:390 start_codon:yes stop_codon:yes gene_type:complete
MDFNSLLDLNKLRSAPELTKSQTKKLLGELETNISKSDWMTIGIMASNDYEAIKALKSISRKYKFIEFVDLDSLHASGRVFLKGNQKTGNVYIRSENGLGEGILLTCQYEDVSSQSDTYGPLPLDFFTS